MIMHVALVIMVLSKLINVVLELRHQIKWRGNDIRTSTDGTSWTSRTSGTNKEIKDVTYGNNTFVGVGFSGTILTSPDGASWTLRTSGTSYNLRGINYVNSTFIAVGESGTILTSSNGITWSSRTSGTSNDLYGVSYKE